MSRIVCLAPFLAALVAPAHAQVPFHRVCLEGADVGFGLSMEVDATGDVHLIRVARVEGDLIHSRVDPAGDAENTVIAERVSRLAVDEIEDTDLLLIDGRPNVCFHNAAARSLEVAFEGPGGWVRETVAEGRHTGAWCNLALLDGDLVVAYHHEDELWFGRRVGADDWQTERIDAPADADVGFEVDLVMAGGELAAAHRDAEGWLRVTWRTDDGWITEVPPLDVRGGVSITAVDDGAGGVWIVHGVRGNQGSDAGMMLTRGVRGALRNGFLDADEVGGSMDAERINGRLAVATREVLRSALFPPADGLRYYGALPNGPDHITVEQFGAAEQRHIYRFVSLAKDPFRLPVIAALDEASPFNDDPGSGTTCLWRSPDRDEDRVPDPAEDRIGTDPDNPDSDGDGRTDGEEWLIDRTDPNGDGPAPPFPDGGGVVAPRDAGVDEDEGVDPDDGVDPDEGVPDEDEGVDGAQADGAADGPVGAEPTSPPDMNHVPPPDGTQPDPADATVSDDAQSPPDPGGDAQAQADADSEKSGGGGSDGCHSVPGALALFWLPIVARRRRR